MNAVTKYDEMRAALAQVHRVDDLQNERNKAEALRQYLKRSGESLHDQNLMAEIRLRFDRRSGELLRETEKNEGGRPGKTPDIMSVVSEDVPPTLAELGITPKQSSRLQAIADIPEEVFERHVEETKAEGEELTTAGLLQAAKDPGYDGDEWYTPDEYIEAVRDVLGEIDLDPASCPEAQEIVQAATYYTKDNDALSSEIAWTGRVWLNPPYSTPLINQFVDKLISQHESGLVTEAIILTNNSTDTGWFHSLLSRYPMCLTRGRIPFWRPNQENFATRQGQAFFYLGSNPVKFKAVFSEFGQVVRKL